MERDLHSMRSNRRKTSADGESDSMDKSVSEVEVMRLHREIRINDTLQYLVIEDITLPLSLMDVENDT